MNRLGFAIALVLVISTSFGPGEARSAAGDSPPRKLQEQIRAYLSERVKDDAFSGVVLLARRGTIIFSGAYGLASKEYVARNVATTRFNLGSINKLMTRVAIAQLVAQHKLAYDQTVGQLLPDLLGKDAAPITVRELLDMTSGIGDFFGPDFAAMPKDRLRTLQDYVPLFADKPLAFPPGSQRRYSNGGYIVLGLIIERVAKQSYYDYVHEQIFIPAAMADSGWPERDAPDRNIAAGYTKGPNGEPGAPWRNNIYMEPARGSSAGGGYASAPDLLKFAVALQAHRLLDDEDTAQVLGEGIGIAGGSPGGNADLEIDPQTGYVLVVLSNYDPPSAEVVAKTIRSWIGLR